jgi:hypothetical protein
LVRITTGRPFKRLRRIAASFASSITLLLGLHERMIDSSSKNGRANPSHDPEKCAAVFRKDHAQSKSESAMTNRSNLIAL